MCWLDLMLVAANAVPVQPAVEIISRANSDLSPPPQHARHLDRADNRHVQAVSVPAWSRGHSLICSVFLVGALFVTVLVSGPAPTFHRVRLRENHDPVVAGDVSGAPARRAR